MPYGSPCSISVAMAPAMPSSSQVPEAGAALMTNLVLRQ